MDVAILKQLINLAAHTTTTGSLKKTAAAREVVGGKIVCFVENWFNNVALNHSQTNLLEAEENRETIFKSLLSD